MHFDSAASIESLVSLSIADLSPQVYKKTAIVAAVTRGDIPYAQLQTKSNGLALGCVICVVDITARTPQSTYLRRKRRDRPDVADLG